MGAQIIYCDGFEVVPPPPEMNDLIFFGSDQSSGGGSNCGESTVTTEEDATVFSGDSSPGWRETKLFSFYFVKQPAYDDHDVKSKIDAADFEIYHWNKRRIDIYSAQKSQRVKKPVFVLCDGYCFQSFDFFYFGFVVVGWLG